MSNKPFHFKQFTIQQDQCAMKVGTDGVLLGAWSSLEHQPVSILDIGAGTGLIALMLAQRSAANPIAIKSIDALEIDADAHEQCVENFEASPWGDLLFCYHAGLDEFVGEMEERYDLIVSNPPFFSPPLGETPKAEENNMDKSRKTARFYNSLPFEELLEGVSKLLSENGVFATIVPFKEEERFLQLAATFGLFPKRVTRVKGNPFSEIKRSLLEFHGKDSHISSDELVIEKERHQYTLEYMALTKDFYLKM